MILAILQAPHVLAAPQEVQVGTYITSISGIDLADGSYSINGMLWFLDPSGGFDPVQDVEFIARKASLSHVKQVVRPDGAAYTVVRLEAVVDQAYDLRDFPFSRQELTLSVEARKDVEDLILVPDSDQSRIADFVSLPSWNINALRMNAVMVTHDSDFGFLTTEQPFSRLSIIIEVAQDRSPLIFEKFSGYLVALILAALVFAVPLTDLGTRLGVTTSSVFAAVFNRYRLGDTVGFDSSFGLMDQVSLLSFGAILSALAISLFAFNRIERHGEAQSRILDRRLGVASMLTFYILIVAAFGAALGA